MRSTSAKISSGRTRPFSWEFVSKETASLCVPSSWGPVLIPAPWHIFFPVYLLGNPSSCRHRAVKSQKWHPLGFQGVGSRGEPGPKCSLMRCGERCVPDLRETFLEPMCPDVCRKWSRALPELGPSWGLAVPGVAPGASGKQGR